jgi:hypothetical protein
MRCGSMELNGFSGLPQGENPDAAIKKAGSIIKSDRIGAETHCICAKFLMF